MIELTREQHQTLAQNGATPPQVRDPETGLTYVLLPADVYERLQALAYDDSPWTAEECHALCAGSRQARGMG